MHERWILITANIGAMYQLKPDQMETVAALEQLYTNGDTHNIGDTIQTLEPMFVMPWTQRILNNVQFCFVVFALFRILI